MKLANLSIEQLKSRLCRVKDSQMGPLLYYLRERLNAQGRAGQGFGAWVAKHLDLSRRTADRWADEYAFTHGLKKRRRQKQPLDNLTKSTADGKYTFQFSFLVTGDEQQLLVWAVNAIGKAKAEQVVKDALLSAAKKRPASVKHNARHTHKARA